MHILEVNRFSTYIHCVLPISFPNISGLDSSLAELTDFICAAQMAKAADAHLAEFDLEEKVLICFFVKIMLFEFLYRFCFICSDHVLSGSNS